MNVYALATELHKFAYEVEELPPEEFAHWLAFFKIRHEEREKARKDAEAKARANTPRTPRRR